MSTRKHRAEYHGRDWLCSATALARLHEMVRKDQAKVRSPRQQFGQILKDLRESKGLSQRDLASAVKAKQSYIAMLEAGQRPPPKLGEISRYAEALSLDDPYEIQRLRAAALGSLDEYANVLLLRRAEIGLEAARYTDIWVVGEKPIEFADKNTFDAVKSSVTTGQTNYVYWIPPSATKSYDKFVNQLCRSVRKNAMAMAQIARRLECILCPDYFCFHQFAIYNPYVPRRRGRLAILGDDQQVIRVAALPQEHVDYLYERLAGIWSDVITNPKERRHPAFSRYPLQAPLQGD